MINGRRCVCLLRKRFRSVRIFSCITPQSPRSSAVEVFERPGDHAPRILQNARVSRRHETAAHNFRKPSLLPVCLLMAIIGSTNPSSERWRRSRMMMSSTTSSSEPGIDADASNSDLFAAPRATLIDFEGIAGFEHEGIFQACEAQMLRQCGVPRQLAILAVNRDEVARPDQIQNQLQFFFAGVAGDVDRRLHGAVDQIGAALARCGSSCGRWPFHCRE